MTDKELSEMTLEELWELFPISLVQHDDKWIDSYREIEATITDLLANYHVERICHIGSTAIHGIWAKNIVDVMIVQIIPEIQFIIITAVPEMDVIYFIGKAFFSITAIK